MKSKTIIKNAIAHLNGYVAILEIEKCIPTLAVKETIAELKKLNHTLKRVDGKVDKAVNRKRE